MAARENTAGHLTLFFIDYAFVEDTEGKGVLEVVSDL